METPTRACQPMAEPKEQSEAGLRVRSASLPPSLPPGHTPFSGVEEFKYNSLKTSTPKNKARFSELCASPGLRSHKPPRSSQAPPSCGSHPPTPTPPIAPVPRTEARPVLPSGSHAFLFAQHRLPFRRRRGEAAAILPLSHARASCAFIAACLAKRTSKAGGGAWREGGGKFAGCRLCGSCSRSRNRSLEGVGAMTAAGETVATACQALPQGTRTLSRGARVSRFAEALLAGASFPTPVREFRAAQPSGPWNAAFVRKQAGTHPPPFPSPLSAGPGKNSSVSPGL